MHLPSIGRKARHILIIVALWSENTDYPLQESDTHRSFAMQIETGPEGSIRDAKIVKPIEGIRFEDMITYLTVPAMLSMLF